MEEAREMRVRLMELLESADDGAAFFFWDLPQRFGLKDGCAGVIRTDGGLGRRVVFGDDGGDRSVGFWALLGSLPHNVIAIPVEYMEMLERVLDREGERAVA